MLPNPARETSFEGKHCTIRIEPRSSGVVLLRIEGTDIGEFANAPMQALNEYLAGKAPTRLFIDAREVRGASIEVSGEWAVWLAKHRARFRDIDMLTGSRFVEVTADFVRRFAALEGVMRIYTDPAAFDTALAEAQTAP